MRSPHLAHQSVKTLEHSRVFSIKETLRIGESLLLYAEIACYVKRRQHGLRARFSMAGNEGFEPPMPDSESGALPLGEFPKEVRNLYRKDGYLQIFLRRCLYYGGEVNHMIGFSCISQEKCIMSIERMYFSYLIQYASYQSSYSAFGCYECFYWSYCPDYPSKWSLYTTSYDEYANVRIFYTLSYGDSIYHRSKTTLENI